MREGFYCAGVEILSSKKARLIGPVADSEWLNVVPWGFGKTLRYVQQRYSDPDIYVTESGVDVPRENSLSLEKALKDNFRVTYFKVGRLVSKFPKSSSDLHVLLGSKHCWGSCRVQPANEETLCQQQGGVPLVAEWVANACVRF